MISGRRLATALLSEARNGQDALNAAWNGVRLTPADAEAHLVLAVVAARLRLFDLAQRAYGEALDLDGTIGDAQRDVGVVRLERRRWAQALERLADAAMPVPEPEAPEVPAPPPPPVSPPSGPVLDRSGLLAGTFRQGVLFASNGTLLAAVLAAVMTIASSGVARMWGGVIGLAERVQAAAQALVRTPAPAVGLARAAPAPAAPERAALARVVVAVAPGVRMVAAARSRRLIRPIPVRAIMVAVATAAPTRRCRARCPSLLAGRRCWSASALSAARCVRVDARSASPDALKPGGSLPPGCLA